MKNIPFHLDKNNTNNKDLNSSKRYNQKNQFQLKHNQTKNILNDSNWKEIGSALNYLVIENKTSNKFISGQQLSFNQNFFGNALIGVLSLVESGINNLILNKTSTLFSNANKNNFSLSKQTFKRNLPTHIIPNITLFTNETLQEKNIVQSKTIENIVSSKFNFEMSSNIKNKIDLNSARKIFELFQREKIVNKVSIQNQKYLINDEKSKESYFLDQLIKEPIIKKVVIQTIQTEYFLDEEKSKKLFEHVLEKKKNLSLYLKTSPVTQWNQLSDREREIIWLESALSDLYEYEYFNAKIFESNNFEKIYLRFLLEKLLFRFSAKDLDEMFERPSLVVANLFRSEWLSNTVNFFANFKWHRFSPLQSYTFDLSALFFHCLKHKKWFTSSEIINAKISNISELRENFYVEIATEINTKKQIESILSLNIRNTNNNNSYAYYNEFSFKNAVGKNFNYFKKKLFLINNNALSEDYLVKQLINYFKQIGESIYYDIGDLEYSLTSIISRYQTYFDHEEIDGLKSLEFLLSKLKDYDKAWESIQTKGNNHSSILMLKPSVMAALHLVATRSILFVEKSWKENIWNSILKQKLNDIFYKPENIALLKFLPISFLDLNATMAFDHFSFLKPFKIDFNGVKESDSDLFFSKNDFDATLDRVNRQIQALRIEILGHERVIIDNVNTDRLTIAMHYLEKEIICSKDFFKPLSQNNATLLALKQYYPELTYADFHTKNILITIESNGASNSKSVNRYNLVETFENALEKNVEKVNETIKFENLLAVYNETIDKYIHNNFDKIIFLANQKIRQLQIPFGNLEFEIEISKIIASTLFLKKTNRLPVKEESSILYMVPFLGAMLSIKEGFESKKIGEFCFGILSLGLDSTIFLSSPLKLAFEEIDLILEAARRSHLFQPFSERIQFQTIGHVVTQLDAEETSVKTVLNQASLNEEDILQSSQILAIHDEKNLAVLSGINSETAAYEIAYLSNEKRSVYIIKDEIENSYLEIDKDSGELIEPRRIIYKDPKNKNFFSSRLINLNYSPDSIEFEMLPQFIRSNQLDAIDFVHPPNNLLDNPVVLQVAHQLIEPSGLSHRILRKNFSNAIKFSHDQSLTMIALEKSIINYINKAISHSSIFRTLLNNFITSEDKGIIINLNKDLISARAYVDLEENSGKAEAMAKDELGQEAESKGLPLQKILTKENIEKKKTQILKMNYRLGIDIPTTEEINSLSYFSYDGEHKFILPQVVFHELVHVLTGLKDISGFDSLGRSLAEQGVGSVDHLTDFILFEVGENIPQRVIYNTKAVKVSLTKKVDQIKFCAKAAMQTEAQCRAIDTLLSNLKYETNEFSQILGVAINSRRTILEEVYLSQALPKFMNQYKNEALLKEKDFLSIVYNKVGLLTNIDTLQLPDELAISFQIAFEKLLESSQTIIEDALYWWNANSKDPKSWNIRIQYIQSKSHLFFDPIHIDYNHQTIDVFFFDQCKYLSERGVKTIQPSRLAALTLEKLFHFELDKAIKASPMKLFDRGRAVLRSNQALKDIGHHLLDDQISYRLFHINEIKIKEELTWMNTQIRRAAAKEDAYLNKILS